MQTFLPYPDFERSARVLDVKRLGEQRVECIQVLRGLVRKDPGHYRALFPDVPDDLEYLWPVRRER